MSVMPEQGVANATQAPAEQLEALLSEQARLDDQLDDALAQFAVYEEHFNVKLNQASEAERPALMAERNGVEESLGIVDIVLRLDDLRDQIQALKR